MIRSGTLLFSCYNKSNEVNYNLAEIDHILKIKSLIYHNNLMLTDAIARDTKRPRIGSTLAEKQ